MELYTAFFNLLKNYTKLFYKNMLFRYIKNPKYLESIYLKGLFLIKNIYSLLLLNNVNSSEIELIIEKAYIYFIEFLIQININVANFELTLKDALMFTYKKSIMSYKQTTYDKTLIDNEVDNKLNIICNIFYIINNANFIDSLKNIHDDEESYTVNLIANKINSINTLENKLLKFIGDNRDILFLNSKLLDVRDNMEKNIEALHYNKSDIDNKNYNSNMLNNIYIMLDNGK